MSLRKKVPVDTNQRKTGVNYRYRDKNERHSINVGAEPKEVKVLCREKRREEFKGEV